MNSSIFAHLEGSTSRVDFRFYWYYTANTMIKQVLNCKNIKYICNEEGSAQIVEGQFSDGMKKNFRLL